MIDASAFEETENLPGGGGGSGGGGVLSKSSPEASSVWIGSLKSSSMSS